MRPHHIIHASAAVALIAIVSSAVLAYSAPVTVVATAPTSTEPVVGSTASPTLAQVLPEIERADVSTAKLGLPLSDALNRVTKKHFGMEVHPETSPVPNDRFNGFHVGVDFEVFEDELDKDVTISAVCDGPLFNKQFAKGYGGYALQSCRIDGDRVTVLYGHMDLESVIATSTSPVKRGQTIGVLGEGYSPETDGVRKHLHLGIHRGADVDIRGYVQATSEVSRWMDALEFMRE